MRRKDTSKIVEKIKWHKLVEGRNEIFFTEMSNWLEDIIVAEEELTMDDVWNSFEDVCVMKAKKHLGVSKGRLKSKKESWWWNDEVASALKSKKCACQEWSKYQSTEENEKEQLH